MTSGTVCTQVFSRNGTRRAQRTFANPGFVGGQMHAFGPSLRAGSQQGHADGGEESTPRSHGIVLRNHRYGSTFFPAELVTDGFFGTNGGAVETSDAAAAVYGFMLAVDAGGLATSGANAALVARFIIDFEAEHGKTGNEPQNSSDGTQCVAKRSAVSPGQVADEHKREQRNHQ